mgnify:CR=1 FL=1|jgi:hypothetical protein|tara:strand:+ start:87 stop:635 length:549 start_codon:yes stop_codon:yes gene_type:complete
MRLNIKIISWFAIAILLVTLIIKMTNLPAAFSFNSRLTLSIIFSLTTVIIGGIILAILTNLLLKKNSFWHFFRIWSLLILTGLHIYFYSPPLKIIIPNNYSGEINLLVFPNSKKDLNINQDGIGYINESILLKSRGDKKPIVYYRNGKKVSPDRIIGYDSIFFYGRTTINQKKALTFKVVAE